MALNKVLHAIFLKTRPNCDSVVEYGNFGVNCGPKQGLACKFSEIVLMEDMIDQNGARFSLGKECENHVKGGGGRR